jgi:hypothetical protein
MMQRSGSGTIVKRAPKCGGEKVKVTEETLRLHGTVQSLDYRKQGDEARRNIEHSYDLAATQLSRKQYPLRFALAKRHWKLAHTRNSKAADKQPQKSAACARCGMCGQRSNGSLVHRSKIKRRYNTKPPPVPLPKINEMMLSMSHGRAILCIWVFTARLGILRYSLFGD